jgi:hypothetical protein
MDYNTGTQSQSKYFQSNHKLTIISLIWPVLGQRQARFVGKQAVLVARFWPEHADFIAAPI